MYGLLYHAMRGRPRLTSSHAPETQIGSWGLAINAIHGTRPVTTLTSRLMEKVRSQRRNPPPGHHLVPYTSGSGYPKFDEL